MLQHEPDWELMQQGPVALYHNAAALNRTISWLQDHGYKVIQVETSGWRTADDMHDGIGTADVAQKLVAQTLAFMGSGHQAGDIDERHRGRYNFVGLIELRQPG